MSAFDNWLRKKNYAWHKLNAMSYAQYKHLKIDYALERLEQIEK